MTSYRFGFLFSVPSSLLGGLMFITCSGFKSLHYLNLTCRLYKVSKRKPSDWGRAASTSFSVLGTKGLRLKQQCMPRAWNLINWMDANESKDKVDYFPLILAFPTFIMWHSPALSGMRRACPEKQKLCQESYLNVEIYGVCNVSP